MANLSIWHWLVIVGLVCAAAWPLVRSLASRLAKRKETDRDVVDRLAPRPPGHRLQSPPATKRPTPPWSEMAIVVCAIALFFAWKNWEQVERYLTAQAHGVVAAGMVKGLVGGAIGAAFGVTMWFIQKLWHRPKSSGESATALTALSKPQSVNLAVNLLWASLAVGLANMLIDLKSLSTIASAAFTNLVLLAVLASTVLLVVKISHGKNWARVAFLVLFVVGMLPTLPMLLEDFERLPVVGALLVVQIGLEGYALYLIFTPPGTLWFRRAVRT